MDADYVVQYLFYQYTGRNSRISLKFVWEKKIKSSIVFQCDSPKTSCKLHEDIVEKYLCDILVFKLISSIFVAEPFWKCEFKTFQCEC